MTEAPFLVRIWGARGSLPAPASPNRVFGTDTCSVEMRCGGHVMLFDVGSGAEAISSMLSREDIKDFDIFFSHCHFDHIMGLPFLKPLYHHDVRARIHAGHFEDDTTCRQMAEGFMSPPYFPITPKYFDADICTWTSVLRMSCDRMPASRSGRSGCAIRTDASAIG